MRDTISWDICVDYAAFSGEPYGEVVEKALRGAELAAEAWEAMSAKTFIGKAQKFYEEEDAVYIYDHLLAHLNHAFIRDWYARWLGPGIAGKRVLEFGAGIGIFAIQAAMDGAEVTYFDKPGVQQEFAKWRVNHVASHLGPLAGSIAFVEEPFGVLAYDVIFSYSVLEHLWLAELKRVLKDMNGALAPGSRMVHFIDPNADKSHPMHYAGTPEAVSTWLESKGYRQIVAPGVPEPGIWEKPA